MTEGYLTFLTLEDCDDYRDYEQLAIQLSSRGFRAEHFQGMYWRSGGGEVEETLQHVIGMVKEFTDGGFSIVIVTFEDGCSRHISRAVMVPARN